MHALPKRHSDSILLPNLQFCSQLCAPCMICLLHCIPRPLCNFASCPIWAPGLHHSFWEAELEYTYFILLTSLRCVDHLSPRESNQLRPGHFVYWPCSLAASNLLVPVVSFATPELKLRQSCVKFRDCSEKRGNFLQNNSFTLLHPLLSLLYMGSCYLHNSS